MTREARRGLRRKAAALVFAVLLTSSVAAPAFAGSFEAGTGDEFVPTSGGVTEPTALDSANESGNPESLPDAEVTTLDGSADEESNGDGPPLSDANRTPVTLITGQTVTVVEAGNETRYRVPDDEQLRKVSTDDATYVYPEGVDFERFDRHLFDVAFLVRQNLTDAETDSIPIIASGSQPDLATTGERTRDAVLGGVDGVERRATLESIDAEAGVVSKDGAERAYAALAADESVERVTLDVKYRLDLEAADEAVGASDARRTHGVSGEGVTVAVLDTGIDRSHPAIDRVVAERDFTREGRTDDPNGHGTHVAGIVASDDERYTGIAPNASLVNARVLNSEGWGYTSWIISGMEYATERDADVISVSIGGSVYAERSNDRYTDAVDRATERGALVVTSAGNGGRSGYGTVSTPGIQSSALTVGASDAREGTVAPFSSRGPTKYGYYLKPDLVAPGVGVTSAKSGTDRFTKKWGTSMAAPAASGAAALVLENHPDWTPRQVKSVLTATADPLGPQDVYTQGGGEVNATAAVGSDLLVSPGTVDFGVVERGDDPARIVTLTNVGNETVELDARATATDVEDGDAERVAVNRTAVTVRPNETAHLELSVGDLPPGTYSGRLSLGEGHSVVFGVVRAHAITVEKAAVEGTTAAGDPVWLFADGGGRAKITGEEGRERLDGSSVTYHAIAGGEYRVVSHGIDESTGQPVVFSKDVTVDGDEHVVLNESDTVARAVNIMGLDNDSKELDADSGSVSTRSVKVDYSMRTSTGRRYAGTVTAASPDDATVRFNPGAAVNATVGRVLVETEDGDRDASGDATGFGASEDASFDSSAIYHLVHRIDGVSGDRTTRVERSALAEKRLTYHRTERDESYEVSMTATADGPAGDRFDHAVAGDLGDRRHQTVYLDDRVETHEVGATARDGAGTDWSLHSARTAFHEPGATYEEEFNRHPYAGSLRWAVRDGELHYHAAGQRDQGDHRFEDERADWIRIERDGKTDFRASLSADPTWRDTGLAVRPGTDLELTVVGRNGATPLSTRTVTTHRATYEPDEDHTPPAIRRVDALDRSTNNTAGGRLRVRFTVDDDAADAEALVAADASSVPFDGDAGDWTPGSVERIRTAGGVAVYEAAFDLDDRFGDHFGPVDLALRVTDERGNAAESTTFDALRMDARPPEVEVESVDATDGPTSAAADAIYANETLTANATARDTSGPVSAVGVELSADFTSFRTETWGTATGGNDWTVTADLRDVPDDGNYTLEAVAVDRFGNENRTASNATVVVDRAAPELGAIVTRVDDETGRVTVSADERLAGTPDATVVHPNGTTTEVPLTRDGDDWTGTFRLDDLGTYVASATGTDLAGNRGRATSTANVESVTVGPDAPAAISPGESAPFVRLHADSAVNDTVAVTGSRSALAPLPRNLAGVEFLHGEVGGELARSLERATVGVPVNESALPAGVASENVAIGYYNQSTGDWELLETAVRTETVDRTTGEYWVANVTHLSTYVAVVEDREPPTLDRRVPHGVTYEYGTRSATVEFEYGDDLSGVDPSAVELYFDGTRVTDARAATVTSDAARYEATDLDGEHTARVEVPDEAGNVAEYAASFAVETDDAPPTVLDASPVDGTEFEAGTDSATLDVSYADGLSGVDTDAVRVRFDGEDVTADAIVTDERVRYVADSLSDGESYSFEVLVEDEAGNPKRYASEFSVAESSASGGGGSSGGNDGDGSDGGSGGSVNVPSPAVQIEVTALSEGRAEATVTSARADSPGRVAPNGGLAGGDVTFQAVSIAPESEDPEPRFLLDLRATASAPEKTPAFEDAGRTLGYLDVVPTYIEDDELGSVGVAFDVDAAATDSPEGVALYRYRGDGWERLETDLVDERGDVYRFRAAAAATGMFAVGLDEPSFEVRDVSLNASEIRIGGSATASAAVENVGTAAGTHTVELTVDGEVVATENVTLAPGERTTVAFTRTFDTPGERVIGIESADAATLSVTADGAEATRTTTQTTMTGTEGDGSDVDEGGEDGEDGDGGPETGADTPGFGTLGALAALLAVMLIARRKRS